MPTTQPDATTAAEQASALKRAEVLVEALPDIRRFEGQLLVVKLGGAAMDEGTARDTVLQDLVLLRFVGLRPVLVHGGGKEITALAGALGLETQFVEGLRGTEGNTKEGGKMGLTGRI